MVVFNASTSPIEAGRPDMSTRAHTVPKFYLNGFIAPGSEHERNPFGVGRLTHDWRCRQAIPEEHLYLTRIVRWEGWI